MTFWCSKSCPLFGVSTVYYTNPVFYLLSATRIIYTNLRRNDVVANVKHHSVVAALVDAVHHEVLGALEQRRPFQLGGDGTLHRTRLLVALLPNHAVPAVGIQYDGLSCDILQRPTKGVNLRMVDG